MNRNEPHAWQPAEASPLIDVAELQSRLGDSALRVVDARFDLTAPEAGRIAHAAARIPGAVYAHLDTDLSDHARPALEGRHPLPGAERFAATLACWRITPATPVVVYDGGSGAMAAARAWWLLRWMGHPDVRVLDGGWAAWLACGAPCESVSRAESVPALGYAQDWQAHSVPVASFDEVASPSINTILVDARAAERFRGEVEPIDARAGHIPGACSRPFTDNLEDGRFKSPEQLRIEWQGLLSEHGRPILYCGSGVTACHNALALVQAGYEMPALFAPSWSGWLAYTALRR